MKDLYRRLGIDPKASTGDVAAALASKPEMGECAAILQDPEKRAGYDQAHATLNAIGILRHRLGLGSGDSWFLENCPDFAPGLLKTEHTSAARMSATGHSLPESYGQPAQQLESAAEAQTPASTNQSYLIIAVVVIALLAILAYAFF
jgi:hypothetical protein